MQNSVLLSTPIQPSMGHFLGIERTEDALLSWLQNQAFELLPNRIFIIASVLFAWVDIHDLAALLEASLIEVSMETQFHQEEQSCTSVHMRRSRYLMEERMYRAQMEVSLLSKAIVNLCEEMDARCHPPFRPRKRLVSDAAWHHARALRVKAPNSINFKPTESIQQKCNTWLLSLSHLQDTSQPIVEVSPCHESVLSPDEQSLILPRSLKPWVNNFTYHVYMSASPTRIDEPTCTNNYDSFKKKELRTMDMLESDLQILTFRKGRAQTEVDMFYEAIERTSELRSTDDGIAASFGLRANGSPNSDLLDELSSTSSASSEASSFINSYFTDL